MLFTIAQYYSTDTRMVSQTDCIYKASKILYLHIDAGSKYKFPCIHFHICNKNFPLSFSNISTYRCIYIVHHKDVIP